MSGLPRLLRRADHDGHDADVAGGVERRAQPAARERRHAQSACELPRLHRTRRQDLPVLKRPRQPLHWVASMERAATIFNDGTFRFAAAQIWHSLGKQNTTGPDQNMASCTSIPHGKPGSCCPQGGCFPKGGVVSTSPLALVVTSLCGL